MGRVSLGCGVSSPGSGCDLEHTQRVTRCNRDQGRARPNRPEAQGRRARSRPASTRTLTRAIAGHDSSSGDVMIIKGCRSVSRGLAESGTTTAHPGMKLALPHPAAGRRGLERGARLEPTMRSLGTATSSRRRGQLSPRAFAKCESSQVFDVVEVRLDDSDREPVGEQGHADRGSWERLATSPKLSPVLQPRCASCERPRRRRVIGRNARGYQPVLARGWVARYRAVRCAIGGPPGTIRAADDDGPTGPSPTRAFRGFGPRDELCPAPGGRGHRYRSSAC